MGLLLALAILSSFYLTPVAMRLAWKHDAVSRPDGFRKKHSRPTPEWGGLAVNASILLGIGLACLLTPIQSPALPFLGGLALSIIILCVLGCYDDLFDMRASVKLAGQLLAVVPLIRIRKTRKMQIPRYQMILMLRSMMTSSKKSILQSEYFIRSLLLWRQLCLLKQPELPMTNRY